MICNKSLTSIRYQNMFTDVHFQVSSFGYECHFDTKENGKILTAKLDGHLTKRWLRGVTPKLSIFSFSWGDTLRNERVLELTTRFLRHEQISAKIKIQKIKNLSWLTSPELPEAFGKSLKKTAVLTNEIYLTQKTKTFRNKFNKLSDSNAEQVETGFFK